MKILHVVPGLQEPTNGIAVAAKWIAEAQRTAGNDVVTMETDRFLSSIFDLGLFSEIWVHSMWLPKTLKACRKVLRSGVPLVRMPHGCLDPVKIRYSHWKKLLVTPFEKRFMRHAARIVATEDAEREWIERFVGGGARRCAAPAVQMLDLGSTVVYHPRPGLGRCKFLFVGRMHPLKGFDVLLDAVRAMKDEGALSADFMLTVIGRDEKELRARFESEVEKHRLPVRFLGEVEESVKRTEMATADCLVLPTLSENFALVVKESLERGVPVITTDGAKIWAGHAGVTYLDGFVAATPKKRRELLLEAMKSDVRGACEV